jgi:LYAR-type C2HC zinc finger
MSDRLDRGDKNDETSTNVDVSLSCVDCGQEFKSRQELKEHESTQH